MNEQTADTPPIKLTQFAKATGCSCKIAPAVLQEIIAGSGAQPAFAQLLVGNNGTDDAAVYQLNETQALISTTDFFTPIVDDAFDYGRIAAANALSDVYAMGGQPIMALAVLGWPVDTLPASLAAEVLAGARSVCAEARIPLAGGHSIITTEPVFGLSVNGMVDVPHLKKNSGAREGDLLLLTKPLGSGILTTARKRGLLDEAHYPELLEQLTKLNAIGAALGKIAGVTAMTDVTGFGLAGHLSEMAEAGHVSAELYWNKVPLLQSAKMYAKQGISPDATFRNWNAVSKSISFGTDVDAMESFSFLPDPQTNGGLLIAVKPSALTEVQECLRNAGYDAFLEPIGRITQKKDCVINILAQV